MDPLSGGLVIDTEPPRGRAADAALHTDLRKSIRPWRRHGPVPISPDDPHAAVLAACWEHLQRQQALGRMMHLTYLATFRTARTFLAAYPSLPLAQLTADHIEQYLTSRGWSPRSMQTVLMRLRHFFRWATERQHLLRENPCDRVSRPRWRAEPRPAPTYQEFLAVCRQCRTLEEAAVVEGFYYTGLRMGEFRSLRVRDVDFARGRAAVLGKGGKRRTVMFPAHVTDLWRVLGGAPDHYLFRGRTSPLRRARREEWIGKTLRRLGVAGGLPYKLTAYVLRHGFFRLMKTRGVSVEVAARLGGHSNIQLTVQVYGRLDDDDLQDAYERAMGEERR